MIIYSTQPNILYPTLNPLILKYQNVLEFKKVFIFDKSDYHKLEKINDNSKAFSKFSTTQTLNYNHTVPQSILDFFITKNSSFENLPLSLNKIYKKLLYDGELDSRYKFDFIFGVFSPEEIKFKIDKDFDYLFTLLDHPITNIYNIYNYLNNVIKRNSKFIDADNSEMDRFHQGFNLKYNTIEKFIDDFIDHGHISFMYRDIKVKNSSHLLSIKDYKKRYYDFNFIGKIDSYENISKSIRRIQSDLKLGNLAEILYPEYLYGKLNKQWKTNAYRLKDIEKLLEEDINFYESLT